MLPATLGGRMDQFEVISSTLSIVIGLSMAHLLWSSAVAFRSRGELKLHWIPFAWALCVFLQHANFLVSALAIDRSVEVWTYSLFLQVLLHAILLFAAGALLLPPESRPAADLLSDFEEHGRFALIPFAAYQALWLSTNFRADRDLSWPADLAAPGNVVNFFVIGLIGVGFFSRRPRVQAATVSMLTAVLIFAMTFLWSQNAI